MGSGQRARFVAVSAAATLVAGVLAACGSSGSGSSAGDSLLPLPVPARVSVTTRRIAGLGTVLADSAGHALYLFPPDAGFRVSCTGACAGTWPPLVIADGAKPSAAGGVRPDALSTLADPNTGARIVTYGGHPLYRYAGDVRAGTADGQALFLDGGPWYVLGTDGKAITADPGGDR